MFYRELALSRIGFYSPSSKGQRGRKSRKRRVPTSERLLLGSNTVVWAAVDRAPGLLKRYQEAIDKLSSY
jgi:hypothetical protein